MRKTKRLILFFIIFFHSQIRLYGKCPKISHTKLSDKMAYANSADPDQKEQSDQGLCCLPLHKYIHAISCWQKSVRFCKFLGEIWWNSVTFLWKSLPSLHK